MLFSQRHGLTPVRQALQVDDMDHDLRTGLWNVIVVFFLYRELYNGAIRVEALSDAPAEARRMMLSIWQDFYKERVDDLPTRWSDCRAKVRQRFFTAVWHKGYDFVEFLAALTDDFVRSSFADACNAVLEKEMSGYRMVDGVVTPIVDKCEIEAVEKALSETWPHDGVRIHLRAALAMLSDRQNPDYRNSIKESISAVEAVAWAITGTKSASLDKALKTIEQRTTLELHPALKEGYEKIYAYTSDAGIRHAMMDDPNLAVEDARYMLVSCSAFVNYLVAKAEKAGITVR